MGLVFALSPSSVSRGTGDELGGALLGAPADVVAWPEQRLRAPVLGSGDGSLREVWRLDGALTAGRHQGVAWRRIGDLLYGVLEIDEGELAPAAGESALQVASRLAYRRIFGLLDEQGLPHLWRVWNYLADINGETQGLERYRQFNIGRQEAFLASDRGATGNVPAACAIGLAEGPLSIAFLAGAVPVLAIENPRQISAYHYPTAYGPRSPTFSRAVLADVAGRDCLFVSGTASIVGHRTVHSGDAVAQCRESMANIAAVLAEANRLTQGPGFAPGDLSYRVYIRRSADFQAVRETLLPLVDGARDIVYLQADICRADLLLEIEAHALGSPGDSR